jgi:hypothetical protein
MRKIYHDHTKEQWGGFQCSTWNTDAAALPNPFATPKKQRFSSKYYILLPYVTIFIPNIAFLLLHETPYNKRAYVYPAPFGRECRVTPICRKSHRRLARELHLAVFILSVLAK